MHCPKPYAVCKGCNFDTITCAYREIKKEYDRKYNLKNKEKLAKQALEWQRNNPEKRKKYRLKYRFGLTVEEYERMLDEQGGVCAICGEPSAGRDLDVDHNHETNQVRGLLCWNCNTGIGKFKDSPMLLKKAIKYLEER